MKKFTLALFALAAALAFAPAAVAQSYDFTITGNGVSASGVITIAGIVGDPGYFGITGITGTYSDGGITTTNITGMYPDPTYGGIEDSNHLFYFDNQFYPSGNGGLFLDGPGMVFDLANGDYVGVCGTGCTTGGLPYNLNVVDTTGNYTHNNEGIGVNFTAVPATVPDGGTTLLLLGLAVAGLAGLRRKLSV
jgi:hypothetical protein